MLDGRIASAVKEDRLWWRHEQMAQFGKTAGGGVARLALSDEDIDCRKLLVNWARELGLACGMDAIGNMFFRYEGVEPSLPPVVSGSHTDSQNPGGRFDGIYGVLAAIEVLHAAVEGGIRTKRPLVAAVWTHEEGSRFVPGCMGSQVFADPSKLEAMLALEDMDGISVAAELDRVRAALSGVESVPLDQKFDSFIEVHIEQGPVLEATQNTIGVVTGIQGTRRYRVRVTGEQAHAGTTPHDLRKDALVSALNIIAALHSLLPKGDDDVRFTIGKLDVSPNGPAVVPGEVSFTIDFRHPDDEVLRKVGNGIESTCEVHSGKCEVVVIEDRYAQTDWFPHRIVSEIESATERLGYPYMRIFSGAGHDARYISYKCPTGMIFIPCEKGISHAEDENAAPGDLSAGAKVLAETMQQLADA